MRTKAWWASLGDVTLIETAWERQMLLDGFERFEQSQIGNNDRGVVFTESAVASVIMRKRFKSVSDAIKKQQRAILKYRLPAERKAAFLILPSDTLALLTMKTLFNKVYMEANPDRGTPYQGIVYSIGGFVETELNFQNWVDESKEKAKEFKDKMGLKTAPASQAEKLIKDAGTVSGKTLSRWRKRFEELSHYKWDKETKLFVGEACAKTAIDALPDDFLLETVWTLGKKLRCVKMTPSLYKEIERQQHNIAVRGVVKKPMIAKPERWAEA